MMPSTVFFSVTLKLKQRPGGSIPRPDVSGGTGFAAGKTRGGMWWENVNWGKQILKPRCADHLHFICLSPYSQ